MKKDLNSDNLHAGHRKRLQSRYELGGAQGMSDHNLLELLLFYSIPRVDTNETAHRLIDTFGSLENVLKADYINLLAVNGVGDKTARQLKLVFDIYNRINEQKAQPKRSMFDKECVRDYLVSRMNKYNDEVLMLLMLNLSGELIRSSIIGVGGKNFVNIDIRKIVEPAYACGATNVIIAHNHTNGRLIPSAEDISATAHVYSSLKPLHLQLSEHYIVNSSGVLGILEYLCNNNNSDIGKLLGND